MSALVVAVGGTCSSTEEQEAPVTATSAVDGAGGAACTTPGTRYLVERFLGDETTDAEKVVATYIAPEPLFQWFSTRERIGKEAANRSSLAGYFEERRRRGVRQRLETLTVSEVDAGHANFTFVITESTEAGSVVYPGKGATDCQSGKFIVWSEGSPQ